MMHNLNPVIYGLNPELFDRGPMDFENGVEWIGIPVLLVLILLTIIFLIFNRLRYQKRISLKSALSDQSDYFITELIFSDIAPDEIKSKIKAFKAEQPFQKKWARNIVLKRLMIFKQNLSGNDAKKILMIYKYFGFHYYSNRLVRKKKWYYKALGMYHYQLLDYKIKTGHIKKHIDARNVYLKSNALIALIVLSDERFDILKDYPGKISPIDEYKMIDILYHKASKLPENIHEWLENQNTSIAILMVKLMVRLRESLTMAQIKKLLKSHDPKLRREAIHAIRQLIVIEANEVLMRHFIAETDKQNRMATISALGIIGNDATKIFMSGFVESERDIEVKFQLVSLLHNIDPNYMVSMPFNNPEEEQMAFRMMQHIKNPYL